MGGTYLSQWRIQTFGWEAGGGGVGAVSKVFFWPFRPQFGPGIRGWGGGGVPLDPPLYLAPIWEYLGI